MPADTYQCPQCRATLRTPPDVEPGDLVQCPKCEAQFPAPEQTAAPLPREPLPARGDILQTPGTSRPMLPEAEDDPFVTDRPRPRVRREPDWDDDEDYPRPSRLHLDAEELARAWSVDLGKWFEYASNHWSAVLGPAVGYGLIFGLIYLAVSIFNGIVGLFVPFAANVIPMFIVPPLTAGWLVVALAQLKREEWTFADFFGGFRYYWPLVAVQLLIVAICIPLALIVLVPVIVLVITKSPPELIVAVVGSIGLLGGCVLIFIITRATFFANQLILDRNYGPIEAMQASWHLSRGHFWGLFGVNLLLGIIMAGGFMLCGIGALFTMPLISLVQAAAYLDVAGTRRPYLWKDN